MSENMIEKRVLALKYRPKRFEDLIGQTTISQTLSLALDSNRLSHAYLFSGLRGSGKTSTARIMAKALLCSSGPTSKPCEVCENCVSANTNRHLDIIEMDAASNRGIDDIKDLIEHTKYKPSSARFKVFIIDEVHMLTTQAFNALLKTLEEPPGFVKFILATTDPLKLPATILSRTQHFRFNKIALNDVIHHLSHILNEENITYEPEALEVLSRTGQGSLRDTLTLLDQSIIFSKGSITLNSVVDMLGLIEPKLMDDIFDVILTKGDINPIIHKLENYEISQVCDEMVIYLKDKMLSKDPKFDLMLFDRFFRIISDSKHLLAINADGGFVLVLTLMKMIEATNLKTIDEIINQVEKIPAKKSEPIVQEAQQVQEVQATVVPTEPEATNTVPEIQQEVLEEQIVQKEEIVQDTHETQDIQEIEEQAPKQAPTFTQPVINEPVVQEVNQNININENLTPFDDGFQVQSQTSTITETTKKIQQEEIQPTDISNTQTFNDANPFDSGFEVQAQTPVQEEIPTQVMHQEQNIQEHIDVIQQETIEQPVQEVSAPISNEAIINQSETKSFENDPGKKQYEVLINKLYDRDFRLGECFEDNFIYNGYENNVLAIISHAQGEERAFLYKHFSLIKTFTQDVFGLNVELDFQKAQEENIAEKKNLTENNEVPSQKEIENNPSQVGSMVEDIEMSSGCVADMHKNSNPNLAQRELQIDDVLNSKMINKAKELFDIKKITVKTRS